jgi:hypothetical protein
VLLLSSAAQLFSNRLGPSIVASAYHVGETVDTDAKVGTERLGVLRRQAPLFGKDSTAEFELQEQDTFTMTFEDGLWGLPSIPVTTRNPNAASASHINSLSSWTLFFVFSKGEIHKVSYDPPVYTSDENLGVTTNFVVHYKWIEEPQLNFRLGQTMMIAIVLVASVVIILAEDGSSEGSPSSAAPNGASRSLPKFE